MNVLIESNDNSLKKVSRGEILNEYKSLPLVTKVIMNNQTKYIFKESYGINTNIPIDQKLDEKNVKNHLISLKSLTYQGLYCEKEKGWLRYFIVNDIAFRLIEDVTEEGGQGSIWSASLVMSEYLHQNQNNYINKSCLELGAGCGLVSMILNSFDSDVVATEQPSCISYLKRNLELNQHLGINVDCQSLYWNKYEKESDCRKDEKYDVIVGCDVTYDPNLFEDILISIKNRLKYDDSYALLSHDNDSCPLSKLAEKNLYVLCEELNFVLENLKIPETNNFYNKKVILWKLRLKSRNREFEFP